MDKKVKKALENIPTKKIGFFPTPLHRLNNISKKYGVDIYMKRDDLSGPEFGGNKIRKLEFIVADAMVKKAEYIITYGAIQTNHGRETIAASRMYGLKPILYLIVEEKPKEFKGNLLLDKIMDAEIHYVIPAQGMGAYEAVVAASENAKDRINELEAEGHKCYDCPAGGFIPLGCLGFVQGFIELENQLKKKSLEVDYIIHATGSGGTLAGLLAGKFITGSGTKIISFSVDKEAPDKIDKISESVREIGRLINVDIDENFSKEEINIDSNYYGEGYEIPNEGSTAAIKELAKEEGIILDPVYTAKAMNGLLDYIKSGKIAKGKKVVFWHTGGTPAIFSEREIVGKVYD